MKTSAEYQTDFKDLNELLRLARQCPPSPDCARAARASHDWDFSVGFDGAFRLAETGWPEGAQKVKDVRDKVEAILKPKTFRQEIEYTVDGGGYVDVGRLLSGEPECFGTFTPPENPTRPVRVVVNLFRSSGVSSDQVMKYGAAVAALIDSLESQGNTVELYIIYAGEGHGSTYSITLPIKEQGQPLDLDRVAFCLAHPAFTRRIVFGARQSDRDEVQRAFRFNRGDSLVSTRVTVEGADIFIGGVDISESENFNTDEDAAEWVRRTLQVNGFSFEIEEEGK